MRFIYALVSALAVAVAQDNSKPNAPKVPSEGTFTGLKAGGSLPLEWTNPSAGTVTILLKEGANSDLKTIKTLASGIQNTGSYTWNIPSDFVEGANYAIEIDSDNNSVPPNYTPQFVVSSDVKAVQTSGGTTSLLTATTAPVATGSSSIITITSAASSAAATGTGSSTHAATNGTVSTGTPSGTARTSGSPAASGSGAPAPSTGAGSTVQAASGLLAIAMGFALAL